MPEVDINQIDQTTSLGQITMLLAVVGVLASAVAPFIPKRGPKSYRARIEIINERLEIESKNSRIVRSINKDLSDWQLIARQLIRVLRNEIINLGGTVSDTAEQLEDQLDEIDNREVDLGDEPV